MITNILKFIWRYLPWTVLIFHKDIFGKQEWSTQLLFMWVALLVLMTIGELKETINDFITPKEENE